MLSTKRRCVFVGGNLVSWRRKKQSVISHSISELEYQGVAQSLCEVIWTHQVLDDIGLKVLSPAKLWCGNQITPYIASNTVFHELLASIATSHVKRLNSKLCQQYISGLTNN